MFKKTLLFITIFAIASSTIASTEKYFNAIKNNPTKLEIFLHDMPKGGDLHSHMSGATMAENMMLDAKNDHFCIDPYTLAVNNNLSCPNNNLLSNATQHHKFYNTIIDAWSMRNFHPGKESGHDHFFATFNKFGPIASKHSGEILSEIVERAGLQNEIYLELMTTTDGNASGLLGKKIGWDTHWIRLRKKLLNNGLKPIITAMSKQVSAIEAIRNHSLHCGTKQAAAGCHVKVRYLYQVLREQPPAQVFAQFLAGFEIASKDPRFVGINLVQAEDGKISMRDYDLQMHMVGFFHRLYPHVRISLHAGELTPSLVPANGLLFHIRDAIEIAHANRIGHGTDIRYETHAQQLLDTMSKKHILVEISLSSNAAILGVSRKNSPLLLYLHYHVPVALCTDDEGVLRTNLTEQYKIAVLNYHFSYPTLKTFARNSIFYSFLPGHNLWLDDQYRTIVPACANNAFNANPISERCQKFLNSNEKAHLQWTLEKQFLLFEARH